MSIASKSKKTKKTSSSSPNKAIRHLEECSVWGWMMENFHGKENINILNISDSNKDTDYLIEKGYNVTQISPNNIEDIEADNQYEIILITYQNKIIANEFERNNILFEAHERRNYAGFTIVSCTNKNLVDEEWDIIEENKNFTIYLV